MDLADRNNAGIKNHSIVNNSANSSVIENKESNKVKYEIHSQQKRTDSISDTEAVEMLEWQRERGYAALLDDGTPVIGAYDNYSDQTLLALAELADPKAMQILGDRSYRSGDVDTAINYYYGAAVLGYSKPTIDVGNIFMSQYYKESDSNKKRELALTAQAWFSLAEIRGDIQVRFTQKMNQLDFTANEKELIEERSKELYRDMLNKRKSLGYNDFDNKTPKAIEKMYGYK